MSEGPSYAAATGLGDVMVGGTVSRVVASQAIRSSRKATWCCRTAAGRSTRSRTATGSTSSIRASPRPSYALGVLGMPGITAYVGTLDIGEPKAGETLVVAAATGAVGSVVGQIAKIKGCRAVGIAGGKEKCDYAVKELGFDACIDHRDANMPALLKDACPKGIDVYFENVGGAVWDAVVPLLNVHARVPLCGLIAQYNATGLPRARIAARSCWACSSSSRSRCRASSSPATTTAFPAFVADMSQWLQAGQDQVSRGHHARAGERAASVHGAVQGQQLRQAAGAGQRLEPTPPAMSRAQKITLLIALYFAQGLPFGFFTIVLPAMLRQSRAVAEDDQPGRHGADAARGC